MKKIRSFVAVVIVTSLLIAGCSGEKPVTLKTSTPTPTEVTGTGQRFHTVVAGADTTCALAYGGQVWCWGENLGGAAGNRKTESHSAPARVEGLSEVRSIAAGLGFFCALSSDRVLCWGSNHQGELGNDSGTHECPSGPCREYPAPVLDAEGRELKGVEHVALGAGRACAKLVSKKTVCWGGLTPEKRGIAYAKEFSDESHGLVLSPYLGYAFLEPGGELKVQREITFSRRFDRLSAGFFHFCGVLADSRVACWGKNDSGQLGTSYQMTEEREQNPLYADGMEKVSKISAGARHTCALREGEVWCWGANELFQLGRGTSLRGPKGVIFGLPEKIEGFHEVTTIASGIAHNCAIKNEAVHCWGSNKNGQLGSEIRE